MLIKACQAAPLFVLCTDTPTCWPARRNAKISILCTSVKAQPQLLAARKSQRPNHQTINWTGCILATSTYGIAISITTYAPQQAPGWALMATSIGNQAGQVKELCSSGAHAWRDLRHVDAALHPHRLFSCVHHPSVQCWVWAGCNSGQQSSQQGPAQPGSLGGPGSRRLDQGQQRHGSSTAPV